MTMVGFLYYMQTDLRAKSALDHSYKGNRMLFTTKPYHVIPVFSGGCTNMAVISWNPHVTKIDCIIVYIRPKKTGIHKQK